MQGGFSYQSYSSNTTKQASNMPIGQMGGQGPRESTVLINAGLTDN